MRPQARRVDTSRFYVPAMCLLLLSYCLGSFVQSYDVPGFDISNKQNPMLLAYDGHPPITISSDLSFSSQALSGNWDGLGTEQEPYIIENYNITDSGDCIFIRDVSVFFEIRSCYLTSSTTEGGYGIHFLNVTNGRVVSCDITFKVTGVFIEESKDCVIESSEIHDHANNGIVMDGATDVIVDSNIITDSAFNGVILRTSDSCIIENNTISGSNREGVELFASLDCTIRKNTIFNNKGGIIANIFSDNNVLSNNTIYSNPVGIDLYRSSNVTVKWNILEYNGIGLRGSDFHSNDCLVDSNTISFSQDYGVYLSEVKWYNLTGNIIINSESSGITINGGQDILVLNNHLENNYMGVDSVADERTTILNNTVVQNRYHGISVFGESASIVGNVVQENEEVGIALRPSCSGGILYGNTIVWNNQNANDDGTNNAWDIGPDKGNTWSDYDGSGDYEIPGSAGSIDRYPIAAPDTKPPTIDSPSDITYYEGITGHTITWNPYDEWPERFEILRNGSVLESGNWDASGAFIVGVDDLDPGVSYYTLVLYDTSENQSNDTVIVTVLPSSTVVTTTTGATTTGATPTTTDGELPGLIDTVLSFLMSFEGIVVVLVIVLIVVAARRR